MALYLAGLRGISHELHEAAPIDGASTWKLYRRIIIPLLAPVTFTAIVLTGMGSIRVFDIPPMLGTGAAFSTDMLAFYMFQLTFQSNRIALGAVIAGVMIILAAFLVVPYLASMQLEAEPMTAATKPFVARRDLLSSSSALRGLLPAARSTCCSSPA